MKVVAIYNMKGGVGKTTAAVNLSYLAAAAGRRVLVWDLDPQAAASFAFRVRPRVDGFGGKHFPSAETFAEAIKETDYANLHLLPADFAYRKLDRLLDEAGKPKRVVRTLIDTLGRDYDLVFLDCPAGFTLVTEGIFAAADAVLVPTVPTVLSLRTLVRLMKWADRSASMARLAATTPTSSLPASFRMRASSSRCRCAACRSPHSRRETPRPRRFRAFGRSVRLACSPTRTPPAMSGTRGKTGGATSRR
jgi:cellulose biosynthesis protein BcsQ